MVNFILGCFVVFSDSPTYYSEGPDSYLKWHTPQGLVRRDISTCIKDVKLFRIYGSRMVSETRRAGEQAKLGLK